MRTSVKLQDPFSYELWIILLLGSIVLLYVLFLILERVWKKRRGKKKVPLPDKEVVAGKVSDKMRSKYLRELAEIEAALDRGEISSKMAYQKISPCLRHFVYEVTGIRVHKYSLSEIKRINLPILEALVTEYYVPEFSLDSVSDVKASLQKTRKAIEEWN